MPEGNFTISVEFDVRGRPEDVQAAAANLRREVTKIQRDPDETDIRGFDLTFLGARVGVR